MPIVYISGVPGEEKEERLERLIDNLQLKVASIKELKLKKSQVTVFFPADRVKSGLGEEVIATVKLFEKKERTKAVRDALAQKVVEVLKGYFPKALIRVLVERFDPKIDSFMQAI